MDIFYIFGAYKSKLVTKTLYRNKVATSKMKIFNPILIQVNKAFLVVPLFHQYSQKHTHNFILIFLKRVKCKCKFKRHHCFPTVSLSVNEFVHFLRYFDFEYEEKKTSRKATIELGSAHIRKT